MKNLFILCLITSGLIVSAQTPKKYAKDDPDARVAFDLLRLQDPKTGKIPEYARQLELEFLLSNQSTQRSTDVSSWINRGPHNVGGRTRALGVDIRNENIILAGGVSGGMWKSVDQGTTWIKTTASTDLQSVTAIAQDPRAGQEDTWYYCTGEITGNSASGAGAPYSGGGVYKSTDNGDSWTLLTSTYDNLPQDNSSDFDYNHEIIVHPVSGEVYIANVGGIYRSRDGGDSFSNVRSASGTWVDIVVSSDGRMFAAIDNAGIYRSTSGTSWQLISSGSGITFGSGQRKELSISPADENTVFMLGESSGGVNGHQIFKYDDTAGEWTDLSANVPDIDSGDQRATGPFGSQGGYDLFVKASPNDPDLVIIGGVNLYRSTDGWTSDINTPAVANPNWIGGYTSQNNSYGLYQNHHPDQHTLAFLSGTKAISANDGGVQLTQDITASPVVWESLNNGYLTTQSYAVSVGPGEQIMSGFQDNSTWLTTDPSPTFSWTDQYGGDGAYSAFNSDGTLRWLSSQNGNIWRFTYPDADSHDPFAFFQFVPGSYSASLFIVPFYLDPQDNNLFYLGGSSTFFVNTEASDGNGINGWKTFTMGNSGVVSEIGVTNFNQVIVGTTSGELYKISNPAGEGTVTEITGTNFPTGYVSGISVNPFDNREILVSFSNYSVQSVFHSTDGGVTWTHVGGNLEENEDGSGNGPSVRTAAIMGNGEKYFVGTSAGIYSTTTLDGASTIWEQEDPAGIGNVVVEHFASRRDGRLVAGSHGNGIFSTDIPVTNAPLTDLALTAISNPSDGPHGIENVSVSIYNAGSASQSSYDLSLYIDDQFIVTETASLVIESNSSETYTFSQGYDFSAIAEYDIRVEISISNDENTSNNMLEKTVATLETLNNFPYYESFEDDNHGWKSTGIWELGVPDKSNVNGTSDGDRAWATDLNDIYPNEHTAILSSPFFDLTSLSSPVISFDINYKIEADWDGAILGYRTSLSGNFNPIFDNGNMINWYPGEAWIFSHFAWQGDTEGNYIKVVADISDLTDQNGIQFGIVFRSDEAVQDEGIAFDNFSLTEAGLPIDIELSNDEIQENEAVGSVIGTLTTVDTDDTMHTYSLESGNDEASFSLSSDQLLTGEVFDFETKTSYTVKIKTADDSGNERSKLFSIEILDDESDNPVLSVGSLKENGIKFYPNPSKNRLNLDMFNDYLGEVKLRVISINGKETVISRIENKTGYSLKGLLDINTLPKGMYIVVLEMGEKTLSGKIIKE